MDDPLCPGAAERLIRARGDLAAGMPVGLTSGGASWISLALEGVRPDRLAAIAAEGRAALVLTHWRARTLKIRVYDGDLARLAVDPGAAAADLEAMADPARDLDRPLQGPFQAIRGGDATPHRAALALVRGLGRLPAVIVAPVERIPEGITVVALPHPARAADPRGVVAARLPTAIAPESRLHVFRDGAEEHMALRIGQVDPAAPVLVRLHSACFTGDVLGSLKCDCGPQLHAAMTTMEAAGGGVLCYLNQEGRGIGLTNKMRAYALQDQGFDTVEANHRLGFEDDERDFALGARMLRAMGINRVRLLTNNPRKVAMLEAGGIEVVERVPLWVGRSEENARYLDTKAARSGHMR